MTNLSHRQNAFNAGELSPRLKGRTDLDKFPAGLALCRNSIVLPIGGVCKRPGFHYINGAKHNDRYASLLPFIFSQDQSYVIEAGDVYFRFYMDGGRITTADANTKLLIHCDGEDKSISFTDDGATGHAVTAYGNAQVDTSEYYFASGSLLLDGTGDYLSVPDHADWAFAANPFTIDMWVRFDTLGAGHQTLISQWDDATHFWYFDVDVANIYFAMHDGATTASCNGAFAFAVDTWYHVAVVLGWGGVADTIAVTVDGDMVDTTVSWPSMPNLANPVIIGSYHTASNFVDGRIDEIRISNVARWTANFTPASQEYPAGGGGTTYEIVSPYTQYEVQDLACLQSADTLYLFHPDHNVYKLVRAGHTSWTCTEIDWAEPPWNPVNTTAITLDPSAITGLNIDVVASAPFFSPNHVGAYFKQANGYYRIITVTDSLNAKADVKDDLDDHVATATWYQGCWDATQGFPTMGTFHEDRLCVIGDDSHPLTVFLSETGNYENMGALSSPVVDSDPVQHKLWTEGENKLRWIKSGKKLFMGTKASEFWMTGETIDAAITPTSVLVRKESTTGSEGIMPVVIGDDIIFVQRGAKTIQAWSYLVDSDGYTGVDLGVLADHFTKDATIQRLAYAQDPSGIIWMQLSNGYLLGFTYLKAHKVVAWHEHDTGADGIIESICVIPGDYDDELWILVNREIGGSDVRYVERLDPQFYGGALASNDGIFVDSCLTYVGAPGLTFTGLSHLEGETVQVLADGIDVGTAVVAAGEITLAATASYVVAGLGFNMNLETLPPPVVLQTGEASDKLKRIVEILFQVYEAGNWKYGRDSSNLLSAGLTSTGATYTGDYLLQFNGDFAYSPSIYIRDDAPTPLTLLAITYPIELEDD